MPSAQGCTLSALFGRKTAGIFGVMFVGASERVGELGCDRSGIPEEGFVFSPASLPACRSFVFLTLLGEEFYVPEQ